MNNQISKRYDVPFMQGTLDREEISPVIVHFGDSEAEYAAIDELKINFPKSDLFIILN